MQRLPPLKALQVFESAARFESFNRAAKDLNVTPSAVSHQVRSLEEAVGVKLFERLNRQVCLTEQGRAYLLPIRDAFEQIRIATDQLRPQAEINAITLSVAPSFAVGWLMVHLPQFQMAFPHIEVRLISTIGLEDFSRPDVDIGIRTGQGNWPGVHSHRLMSEALVPLCSPGLIESGMPLREPRDLANTTLIHDMPRLGQWRSWLAALGIHDVDAERGPKFQGAGMAVEAAIAGLGVVLANRRMVEVHLKDRRLIIPFDIQLPSESAYYLVYPEEGVGSEKIEVFKNWILNAIEQDTESISVET